MEIIDRNGPMILLKIKSVKYRNTQLLMFYEIRGKDWMLCTSSLNCFRTIRDKSREIKNLNPYELVKGDMIWVDNAFLSDKSLIETKSLKLSKK